MLPLSNGLPARRFPVVNILLIVANFAVFIFYELPDMNSAVYHASFYPCTVDGLVPQQLPGGDAAGAAAQFSMLTTAGFDTDTAVGGLTAFSFPSEKRWRKASGPRADYSPVKQPWRPWSAGWPE
jgi:hypothetical protein